MQYKLWPCIKMAEYVAICKYKVSRLYSPGIVAIVQILHMSLAIK